MTESSFRVCKNFKLTRITGNFFPLRWCAYNYFRRHLFSTHHSRRSFTREVCERFVVVALLLTCCYIATHRRDTPENYFFFAAVGVQIDIRCFFCYSPIVGNFVLSGSYRLRCVRTGYTRSGAVYCRSRISVVKRLYFVVSRQHAPLRRRWRVFDEYRSFERISFNVKLFFINQRNFTSLRIWRLRLLNNRCMT